MPKAIRYRANGQYLQNTMFWSTNADFIGAFHGCPTDAIYDPVLAAQEEAATIESHRQDFAAAFGIPAEQIECEVIAGWTGDPAKLPYAADDAGALERLPVDDPPPPPPTLAQKVDALIAALPAETQASIAASLKG